MTTILLAPAATIEIDGDDYQVEEGDITLDLSAVPYVQAQVTLPLLADSTLEWLDPRDGIRTPLTGSDTIDSSSRVFDLGVTARTVDHEAKTVQVSLASDEAILQRHTALADDRTPLTLAGSLRNVVDYVLNIAIPSAALEAGTDAAVTPLWDATNLVGNSGFEGNVTTGYVAGSNVSGFVITTSAGFVATGLRAMRYTSTAAGNSRLDVGSSSAAFSATAGRTYGFSFWHRSSVARSGVAGIRFVNKDGDVLATITENFTSSSSAMGRAVVYGQAPAGTASIWPYVITLSNSAGQFHYIDDVMVGEGEFMPDFFDGGFTDTASYDYAFAGAANASQSIRTALVDAPAPDALVWRAGQTAWDFLMPLCATVNMVLWCDENRDWYLATPEDRSVPSSVYVSPLNTARGSDTIDLGSQQTVTGVVLRYEWTDPDGIARTRVDAAGTPDNVLVQTLEQAYPGPGAAAAMLARFGGSGREQDAEVTTQWGATPGMSLVITLPGAPETEGRLQAVTFDLSTGLMQLTAAGLLDIVPGSIATLTGTIADLPGTIASL